MSYASTERKNVYRLRRQLLSYSEINKITKIPKSTLSDWLSDEKWSIEIRNNLASQHLINYKSNLIKSLKIIKAKKYIRYAKFRKQALSEYIKYRNDPLFIFGLGLYWGEGDKKSVYSVAITNSDSDILYVSAKFFRKYLCINENNFRIRLFIYEVINLEFAINFS